MSGTPAFTYEIKQSKNGRAPQVVIVQQDGVKREFLFGHHISKKKISEMLPRLIMDSKFKPRKKAV